MRVVSRPETEQTSRFTVGDSRFSVKALRTFSPPCLGFGCIPGFHFDIVSILAAIPVTASKCVLFQQPVSFCLCGEALVPVQGDEVVAAVSDTGTALVNPLPYFGAVDTITGHCE